jgi:hypothetical protein
MRALKDQGQTINDIFAASGCQLTPSKRGAIVSGTQWRAAAWRANWVKKQKRHGFHAIKKPIGRHDPPTEPQINSQFLAFSWISWLQLLITPPT